MSRPGIHTSGTSFGGLTMGLLPCMHGSTSAYIHIASGSHERILTCMCTFWTDSNEHRRPFSFLAFCLLASIPRLVLQFEEVLWLAAARQLHQIDRREVGGWRRSRPIGVNHSVHGCFIGETVRVEEELVHNFVRLPSGPGLLDRMVERVKAEHISVPVSRPRFVTILDVFCP